MHNTELKVERLERLKETAASKEVKPLTGDQAIQPEVKNRLAVKETNRSMHSEASNVRSSSSSLA